MLWSERSGQGGRLVLAHGFTQNGRCWGPVADDLARDHEVVRVDLPGHGRSSDVTADLVTGAGLLAVAGGPGTYLGYSLGGRLCLHAALERPAFVQALVLVGATGGIDDPSERAVRRDADEELAARLEGEGVDAFLEHWLRLPLFAGLDDATAAREARRDNTAAGLASSLRLAGTGTQEPLWDRLPAVEVPVLVTAGERDERFAALGSRLVDAIGANATLALVPDAGHAAHLEQPYAFLDVVRPWLEHHDR